MKIVITGKYLQINNMNMYTRFCCNPITSILTLCASEKGPYCSNYYIMQHYTNWVATHMLQTLNSYKNFGITKFEVILKQRTAKIVGSQYG